MCGIAGFHLKDPHWVTKHENMELFADLLLQGIEQRGKQATGMLAVTPESRVVEVHKEPLNASDFIKFRKKIPVGAQTVLLHTRWATKGDNDKNGNLHPVVYGSCFATHNGSIDNDDELFASHKLKRHAEVDTEIIPALLDKYGWDNAAEALHELEGSFAIAAVDPIKHKNQVLLAKGRYSPLVVHETDHFIVWASLSSTIRDAWKVVLGTPPDWKNLRHLKDGEMLRINGDVMIDDKFEVKERPFQSTSSIGNVVGRIGPNGRQPVQASYTRGVIKNRKAEVADKRLQGLGLARIWIDKMCYDRDKMFQDLGGTITWNGCPGCDELVFGADFALIVGEGRVCLDCYDVATGHEEFVIDSETKAALERWVAKESLAHDLALNAVEARTGLSPQVVEYLIYRIPEAYTTKHPNMADLSAKVDEMYQKDLLEAFDSLMDEHNDDNTSLDDAFKTAVANDDREDKQRFEKCNVCKRFKSKHRPCRPCQMAAEKEAAEKAAPKSEVSTVQTVDIGKCWCGEPSTVRLGKLAGFCSTHYDRCNVEDCVYGPFANGKRMAEPGIANHLRSDGRRVCHFHARNVKGVWSDKLIEKAGVVVSVSDPGGL